MVYLFLHNSRALLPTFRTNCPDGSEMGSLFAQMGSLFAQISTQTPVRYSVVTHPFRGYVRT